MDPRNLITDLEAEASKRRIAVDELCRRIDINRVTWQRIKKGTNKPSLKTFFALQGLLAAIQKEPVPEPKPDKAA